jgi:hypothetical protein
MKSEMVLAEEAKTNLMKNGEFRSSVYTFC